MSRINVIAWEDSEIERQVLLEILHFDHYPKNNHILLPGSSGDTALSLLDFQNDIIEDITCVGSSGRDLAVIELKGQILKNLPNPESRVTFLEGKMNWQKVISLFMKWQNSLQSQVYWKRHQKDIIAGIHHRDRWLSLFSKCQEEIKAVHRSYTLLGLLPTPVDEIEIQNEACQEVFSNHEMIQFGGKAILDLSFKIPMYRRILDVFNQHKNNPDYESNPFYHLMFHGKYGPAIYPNYLHLDSNKIKMEKLRLINQNFWTYLENTDRRFSLISLGNLTDFLDQEQLIFNLELIYSKVKSTGRVLFRRMTNDLPLRPFVNKLFMILDLDRDFLVDRTHFYKEIILATPRVTRTKHTD